MKLLTKLTALIAGIAVLGSTSLVANAKPKNHMHSTMSGKRVHVHGYTRHLKSGKTVHVHGYMRTMHSHKPKPHM
jgi:hypothetical protein